MASQLGPIEVSCDAPPYAIVEACEKLAFQKPLDVRWFRMRHFLGMIGPRVWNMFFTRGTEKKNCTCGMPLPMMENYLFTFSRGDVLSFDLGQCQKCHTIFWEEGTVPEFGEELEE
jgi:hypothetical protein